MKRSISRYLSNWLIAPSSPRAEPPILLRGARQVGKSYAVRQLHEQFPEIPYTELNFELEPALKQIFERDLVPDRILSELSLVKGAQVTTPGGLLFFDEVQACPNCIKALRYFYELRPDMKIIAAGSLLDFVLQDEEMRFPVGRIQSLFLGPLSFGEFLSALGKTTLLEFIEGSGITMPVPEIAHQELMAQLKSYFLVGGMPEAVARFIETHNFAIASEVHAKIIQGYRDDFARYARREQWELLLAVMDRVARYVGGTKITYTRLGPDYRIPQIKRAISLLEHARILSRVRSTQAKELPLAAHVSDKDFKLLYLDIGLLSHQLGTDLRQLSEQDSLTTMYKGMLAEQFVGQQLLSSLPLSTQPELFYWNRDVQGAQAEVDFVIPHRGYPSPVEVKSGALGKLRSLAMYQRDFKPKVSFLLSASNAQIMDGVVIRLPLYRAGYLS